MIMGSEIFQWNVVRWILIMGIWLCPVETNRSHWYTRTCLRFTATIRKLNSAAQKIQTIATLPRLEGKVSVTDLACG